MRVLHVIPSIAERSGGPGQAIIPMCRTLQDQGTEVLIVTTETDSNSEIRIGSAGPGRYKNVPTMVFPAQWGDSFKYSRPLSRWLDSNVNSFDIVHIHAVFNHACMAAARACRRHGVPYVVRPLGTLDPWSMKQKPLRKMLFWTAAGKRMLHDAAAIHYTARGEQKAAEESLGLNHGRVVPLGVENVLSVDGKAFQSDFPSLANHPYVLVLSRLHPKKGLDVLVDSFLSLVKQEMFQDWRLVLAGDGAPDYVETLKQKVAAGNGLDKVLFPGWLEGEQKLSVLHNASLLALPSHHENFGLCVIEALAHGVPVLISPHVNLAADIETANAGWIAPVDKDAIEAALAEAMSSPEERERRGQTGKVLSANFGWPRVAHQLVTMYQEVLRPAKS